MIRIYYITSLWDIKKIHVNLGISSCWHIFHCVGWAGGATCGKVYLPLDDDFDWLEDFENCCTESGKVEQFGKNVSINRFISKKHLKFKQNIIGPFFGNSSLAFIKAREIFLNMGGKCRAFYSLGFNLVEFAQALAHFVSNSIFFWANDFLFNPDKP